MQSYVLHRPYKGEAKMEAGQNPARYRHCDEGVLFEDNCKETVQYDTFGKVNKVMKAKSGNSISFNTLRTLYVSGLPYDMYHGITAAVCMFVIGNPMIEKLERIKIKYGIYR